MDVGFHALHLVLFLAVPALVFVDLNRSDSRHVAILGAGLVALSAGGLSWSVVRSGDSNSLAGLVCVLATIAASHRARTGARYGLTTLVVVLAATACSHIGFFA
jgi:hypothetical protein